MLDSTAIIHPTARLAENVEVGPWTLIGPDVEIGEGTWIGSHVVIKGPTRIGKNNRIFPFSSLGEMPQDKRYRDEKTSLEIGDNNIIREFCTINRGTPNGKAFTRIGNHNFLMAYVHIAHDCEVGDHTVFANNASLAGHVIVEDHVILSGFAGVHQFCNVGRYSFIGKATYVTQDILPYLLVSGYTPEVYGLNVKGLQRNHFQPQTIETLKKAYKVIFKQGLTVPHAVETLQTFLSTCPEVQYFIEALQRATRGITR